MAVRFWCAAEAALCVASGASARSAIYTCVFDGGTRQSAEAIEACITENWRGHSVEPLVQRRQQGAGSGVHLMAGPLAMIDIDANYKPARAQLMMGTAPDPMAAKLVEAARRCL